MAGLIDNVLDFARGRMGGGLALNRTSEPPLGPALEQVVEELRTTWPDRVIDAEIHLVEPISCDRDRIGQLLSNLLANAITHGAADGPVSVRASSQDCVFRLSVSNPGVPIPPSTIERLFQPFFRASARAPHQGLGLGLYIASEIARAHGGKLAVTSTSQETCFTLTMPSSP
jgi:sigma-B regulation protein RsbU (phosphoserine phosphatase)